MGDEVTLLLGTRKGAWIARSDAGRERWALDGPHHLGNMVHHLVRDPRDGRTLLAAARTGHLGPTVFRSADMGERWKEASKPPAFDKVPAGEKGRAVDHVFWLTPGHADQPGVWYAGTSPQGLFRSEDGGDTWHAIAGFNGHPDLETWTGGDKDGTPDGPKLHSVIVHPDDPDHLYIGMSGGGSFESRDAGATWSPLNKGVAMDFAPPGDYEYGHDPHCMVLHPADSNRLYQQNHCGIYRLDRPADTWVRIGDNMPRDVGDIGFPIVVHPRDRDTAWVFPMDGTDVWPRTAVRGKPAVYRTRDGGQAWQRQDNGLPREQAWLTVMRQAMVVDACKTIGVYFGTTQGELWASRDEGASWRCIARHLPRIYAVEVA
ncbi:MAG: hypothetical protein OXT09_23260 [Myxococcales bacterium]|nr:hypothetical protein [Myxococcales bacterium]